MIFMDTTRPMTRSPVALARKALQIARRSSLPAYSSRFSRQDFTQHQLFALMVLGTSLKLDHRGIVAVVADWSDVREAIGLKRVPHFSTLYKAQQRLLKKVCSIDCSTRSLPTRSGGNSSARKRRPASIPRVWRPGTARRITPTGSGKNATEFVAGPS
jgi:hypothetical protein